MTLQSPTATLIPLFCSSELTGCGYPGLLDRKNRSDMCPVGSRTLDFLRARRAPYPLGQVLRYMHTIISLTYYIYCGLFHCYILGEFICDFRGVRSILSLLFYFRWKVLLANNVNPDQKPHNVASDLGLNCLPMTLERISRKEWVNLCMPNRLSYSEMYESICQRGGV